MTIAEQVTRLKTDLDEVKLAGDIEGFNRGYDEGYDAGYDEGQSAGGDTDAAYQQGVEAERKSFWDAFQWKGTRTSYVMYAFGAGSFSFDNFFPKYDIAPTGSCQYLFYNWRATQDAGQGANATGSLTQRLKECGVTLDTSKCERLTGLFGYGYFTELPPINCTGLIYDSTGLYNYCTKVVTIGTITTKEDVKYTQWFDRCDSLKNITFDGEIGQNIDLHWSTKLSKASITNDDKTGIIDALSTVASGMTLTLSKTAVTDAFGSTEADEWVNLINTKSNWTITFA